MIRETGGNIFLSKQKTLLVPCNAAGAMGKGLALAFKRRYFPHLFRTYRRYFPLVLDPIELRAYTHRAYQLVSVELPRLKGQPPEAPDHRALLFCTKYHWSESADISLIARNLETLRDDWQRLGIESLALPPIGCGLGGLDYKRDIRPLLFNYLGDDKFDVEVVGLTADDMS